MASGQSSWEVGDWYSLVHVALGASREVCLHDRLELRLVAAVFEDRVVMVTAEDEGFVVREPGAVKAKVVSAFVVCVRLTDPEMCGQDWNTETPGLPGTPWQPTGDEQKGLGVCSGVLLAPPFLRNSLGSRKSLTSAPKPPGPLIPSSDTTTALIPQPGCSLGSLKLTCRWVTSNTSAHSD